MQDLEGDPSGVTPSVHSSHTAGQSERVARVQREPCLVQMHRYEQLGVSSSPCSRVYLPRHTSQFALLQVGPQEYDHGENEP